MPSIEERLVALERRCRRATQANVALVVLLVVGLGMAGAAGQSQGPGTSRSQQLQTPQAVQEPTRGKPAPGRNHGGEPGRAPEADGVVDAQRFTLRDAAGAVRATLAIEGGSPVLTLLGDTGRTRVSPSGIAVVDRDDAQRLVMALINGSFPLIGVSTGGQQGPPSVEITAADDGSRKLALHDTAGRPLVSITAGTQGAALALRHTDDERTLQITGGTPASEGPTVDLIAPAEPDGTGGTLPRLRMGLRREGEPFLQLNDARGRPEFVAPRAKTP